MKIFSILKNCDYCKVTKVITDLETLDYCFLSVFTPHFSMLDTKLILIIFRFFCEILMLGLEKYQSSKTFGLISSNSLSIFNIDS